MVGEYYLTETHCHTAAGSACGKIEPEDQIDHYKAIGYDTVFLTEHFPIAAKRFGMPEATHEERVDKMLTGFTRARKRGEEIGLLVLFAFEFGYKGNDTLTYGLEPSFLYDHPEIAGMDPVDFAVIAREAGAFLVQAHPFREAKHIKMMRLFPRSVDAVEIFNAHCPDEINELAARYAETFGLSVSGGSDNHSGVQSRYGGLLTKTPIQNSADLAAAILSGAARIYKASDQS